MENGPGMYGVNMGKYPRVKLTQRPTEECYQIQCTMINRHLKLCGKKYVTMGYNSSVIAPLYRLCPTCTGDIRLTDENIGNNCTNSYCIKCKIWICMSCITPVKSIGDHASCQCVTNDTMKEFLKDKILIQGIDSDGTISYNCISRW